MDSATIFQMCVRAFCNRNLDDFYLLVDALNDANLSAEAEFLYDACNLAKSNIAEHFQKLILQKLFQRSGKLWSCSRSGHYYIISSPMKRRVAKQGNMTKNILDKQDKEFLQSVFTGKNFYFSGNDSHIHIPGSPAFLQYALDLVQGIERLDLRYSDQRDYSPMSVIQASLTFLTSSPLPVPMRIERQ